MPGQSSRVKFLRPAEQLSHKLKPSFYHLSWRTPPKKAPHVRHLPPLATLRQGVGKVLA